MLNTTWPPSFNTRGRGNSRSTLSLAKPSTFAEPDMTWCPQCREFGDDHSLSAHPQGYGLLCNVCGYQDEAANQPELSDGYVAQRRDAQGEIVTDDAVHKIKEYLESPQGLDLQLITDYLLVDPPTRLFPFAAHKLKREACRIHVHTLQVRRKHRLDAKKDLRAAAGLNWNERYMAAAAIKIACSQHNEAVISERRKGGEMMLRSRLESDIVVQPSVNSIAARLAALYPAVRPEEGTSYGEIEPVRLARIISRASALIDYTPEPSADIIARIEPIILHLEDIQSAMHRSSDSAIDSALSSVLVYRHPTQGSEYRKLWGGTAHAKTEGKHKRWLGSIDLANVRSLVANVFLISSVMGLWEGCLPDSVAAALVITALEAEAGFKADPKDSLEHELGTFSDAPRYTIADHCYKLREVAELWAPTLPRIGVPIPPIPARGRKHTGDGAKGGFGFLGDMRRVATSRDKAAAWWKALCENAQELIHYRIKNPDLPTAPRWERERSRSQSSSVAPSPSPAPSFGPQLPPSPATTVASLAETDDLERAIYNADDSSDPESPDDSDAESVVSARTLRLRRRQRGAFANDAGPLHISIDYPVGANRSPRPRAASIASDTSVSRASSSSSRAWTPMLTMEDDLGPKVRLDRPPYDPIADHGLLIGERSLIIRQRPNTLRKRGLLVNDQVQDAMLAQLAKSRANGEIPRRLVEDVRKKPDLRPYLDRAAIDGIHPLRALLVAGIEPDEIPHHLLVHSPIAFRCAWQGLDPLTCPLTDDELLGDEFEVNLRSREERRRYDAELHIDGIWDQWCAAEEKREQLLAQKAARKEAAAARARKVGQKIKSRRLDLAPVSDDEEYDDPDVSEGLEYSVRDMDLAPLNIPGLKMGLVAKLTKDRGIITPRAGAGSTKKRAPASDNESTPTKRQRNDARPRIVY